MGLIPPHAVLGVIRVQVAVVDKRAQAVPMPSRGCELLSDGAEGCRCYNGTIRFLQDVLAQSVTGKGHQYSRQIRQRFVDSQGLGRSGVQQVWCDAINDGVTRLMGDDVPR